MNKKKIRIERGNFQFIFISIIYGVVLVEFFNIWSYFPKDDILNAAFLPPSILSVCSTLLLLEFWWAEYDCIERIGSSFINFIISVMQTFFFYLIGVTLKSIFENAYFKTSNLMQEYFSQCDKLYIFAIILVILFILEDFGYKAKLANTFRIIAIVLCTLPILIDRHIIHMIFAYSIFMNVIIFTILKMRTYKI